MNSEKAPNIFMLRNTNVITVIITLEGIYKIKTEKNDNKTVRTHASVYKLQMAFIFPAMKIYQAKLTSYTDSRH